MNINLQAANLKDRGLKTGVLGVDSEDALTAGDFQIVFSSPEMLFMRKRWRDVDVRHLFVSAASPYYR